MDFLIAFIVVTTAYVEVHGKQSDTGRQVLNNPPYLQPQSGQQRYATKEIILYLTPSQIRALQEGQGLNLPQHPADNDKHTQAYHGSPQTSARHQNEQQLFKPSAQEPQSDHFVPIIPPPDYRRPENYGHNIHNRGQPQNQKRIPQEIPFFSGPNKQEPNGEPKILPGPNSEQPQQGGDHDSQITRQQLKAQWLDLLNQNIAHFKALSQSPRDKSNENKINFHYLSQNDHRYASDVYSLVRSHNEHQVEKQQALLQAEAIANSPPVLVHKEINIRHTPAHVIAHVPVPTPFLIPVPESINIKVPQAYAFPLELIRTLPVPIGRTQATAVNRQTPIEVEKRNPEPVTRNVHIDRPFAVDGSASLENPIHNQGSLPVHRHEWHH